MPRDVSGLRIVDLDNCASEPIHVPGSIQPRGYLIVANEVDLRIVQVSDNIDEIARAGVMDLLGEPLAAAVGAEAAASIGQAVVRFTDLRARNPLPVLVDTGADLVEFDAVLSRLEAGRLLVELERAAGPRPFSFPNTYQAVRGAVTDLNRAGDVDELYQVAAQSIRDLTGFDRVMVYRYDHEFNGEVVAEAKRADLNPFLGLHYPASDIPAQARALYERSWIRLISDVDYVPVPIRPVLDPDTGAQLDLTFATLRSVSPVHIEYLHNMGVRASMSISLLRKGVLWGLIACHHYSGPHTPPYGVRAAAEFLGSTLSLRLVDRVEDDELRSAIAAQSVLARITAAAADAGEPIVSAFLGTPSLLDLLPAAGVIVSAQGHTTASGDVPEPAAVAAMVRWARSGGDEIAWTDSLATAVPELDLPATVASGALVVLLPDEQFVMWVRPETRHNVDWGGDPANKAIAQREGAEVRLSPRKSFERWREVVQHRSEPWTNEQQALARQLRRVTIELLYTRAQSDLRLAEVLHRSLLPVLPAIAGWDISAHYQTAEGGRVGGDWYDAFSLTNGLTAIVVGDVAGHGIASAGTMAKLSTALRAYLLDDPSPARALTQLSQFVDELLPGTFATVFVACLDTATGVAQATSAGHPPPYLVSDDATAAPVVVAVSPPLGMRGASYTQTRFVLGDARLVLYSDGLIERRDEDLDIGFERLRQSLTRLGPQTAAADVFTAVVRPGAEDDATVMTLRRSRPTE